MNGPLADTRKYVYQILSTVDEEKGSIQGANVSNVVKACPTLTLNIAFDSEVLINWDWRADDFLLILWWLLWVIVLCFESLLVP